MAPSRCRKRYAYAKAGTVACTSSCQNHHDDEDEQHAFPPPHGNSSCSMVDAQCGNIESMDKAAARLLIGFFNLGCLVHLLVLVPFRAHQHLCIRGAKKGFCVYLRTPGPSLTKPSFPLIRFSFFCLSHAISIICISSVTLWHCHFLQHFEFSICVFAGLNLRNLGDGFGGCRLSALHIPTFTHSEHVKEHQSPEPILPLERVTAHVALQDRQDILCSNTTQITQYKFQKRFHK